jgi:hypothetical protein
MSSQALLDILVTLHLAFVLFVLIGQLLIVVGWACGWSWVRNFWFRAVHLLCIAVVAAEGMGKVTCPITIWENRVRYDSEPAVEHPEGRSAIARRSHELLYQPGDAKWYRLGHIAFGVLVLLTFVLVPPRLPWRKRAVPPAATPARSASEGADTSPTR